MKTKVFIPLLLLFILATMCFSCSGQNGISEDKKTQIQEVIENHDTDFHLERKLWSEQKHARNKHQALS